MHTPKTTKILGLYRVYRNIFYKTVNICLDCGIEVSKSKNIDMWNVCAGINYDLPPCLMESSAEH